MANQWGFFYKKQTEKLSWWPDLGRGWQTTSCSASSKGGPGGFVFACHGDGELNGSARRLFIGRQRQNHFARRSRNTQIVKLVVVEIRGVLNAPPPYLEQ